MNDRRKLVKKRTCRACREKKDKKKLVRLILLNTKTLEVDPKQIMPGRGWYLCPAENCLSCLKEPKSRQKAFGHGLEVGPKLNTFLTILPAGGVNGQN